MNRRNEIIIIGGGVIGACIAYCSISLKRTTSSSTIPLSLVDQKVAVTPMGDQLRMSSKVELVGYDSTINRRRLAATRGAVNMYLSGFDGNKLFLNANVSGQLEAGAIVEAPSYPLNCRVMPPMFGSTDFVEPKK